MTADQGRRTRWAYPPTPRQRFVNLTIAVPGSPGFATIYPCTAQPPTASNINYLAGCVHRQRCDGHARAPTATPASSRWPAADIIVDVDGYLPGLGAGTRAIDVRVVDNHGNPFAVGQGSVMACPSEGFAVPCAALIGGTLSDAAGGSTIMLSENVEYVVTATATNTGWPNPWIAPGGTEFHFSDPDDIRSRPSTEPFS